MSQAKPQKLKQLIESQGLLNAHQTNIADFVRTTAFLAGVDGAIVMTRKLGVVGFGSEIVVSRRSIHTVRIAHDPEGSRFEEVPIERYGTRHRSAVRLAAEIRGVICLVVSQDGGLRAVTGVRDQVFMWNDVRMGASTM